jgi:cobaltochelatase CobT
LLSSVFSITRRKSQSGPRDDAKDQVGERRNATKQAGPSGEPPGAAPEAPGPYHPYSTAFDEEIRAHKIAGSDERAALWQRLNVGLPPVRSAVSRLANRMQRRLLAKQRRAWDFGLEEGLPDVARLSRIVTTPSDHRVFKQHRHSLVENTVVTLLLDNSGSMRGDAIVTAAICADVLAQVMERCKVRVEVLGFTTTHWDGGPLRQQWLADRQPRHPGRLNGVRHIVYKAADTPWRRSRQDIALMLQADLLKENIDGEALLWAHRRMMGRPEARKILMVISDGSPRDESTVLANGGAYLKEHLHTVIRHIEQQSPVHLLAIGIAHDVTHYYRHAISIWHHEQLGGTMIKELERLFDAPRPPHPVAARRGR